MYRIATLAIVLTFSLIGAVASAVHADNLGPRHARLEARIHSGVESGSLVPREVHRLRHEQRHIQNTRNRMRANDGKIGAIGRARLHRMQDRASRHIYRAKHNRRGGANS